jgi:hypothetical protein
MADLPRATRRAIALTVATMLLIWVATMLVLRSRGADWPTAYMAGIGTALFLVIVLSTLGMLFCPNYGKPPRAPRVRPRKFAK